jgi:hypothetical protein
MTLDDLFHSARNGPTYTELQYTFAKPVVSSLTHIDDRVHESRHLELHQREQKPKGRHHAPYVQQ